jgi:SAM-dependent methyltransferase
VIGIDQSPAMLDTARKRTASLDNVELRQGGLEALPLADAECDAALLILTLGYLADVAPALREVARAVKHGGRVVIMDVLRHDSEDFRVRMGQHHSGFEPETLSAFMRDAGFTEIRTRSLAPAPQTLGPALIVASAVRNGDAPFKKQDREGDKTP